MVPRLLFDYQLTGLDRWRRLSPRGKLWWGVRKALLFAVVFTVVTGACLWSVHGAALAPVLDGEASVLTLAGPLVASLPAVAVIAVASLPAAVVSTRRENDVHY
jgi:hypothetical protein